MNCQKKVNSKIKFPYDIVPVEPNLNQELVELFKGQDKGFCQVGPEKWLLPVLYAPYAEHYYNFEPKQDDLWIITWPRSGTTLTQELVWLLNNNLDYKTSSELSIFERYIFLEFNMIMSEKFREGLTQLNVNNKDAVDAIAAFGVPGYIRAMKSPSPRYIKTHLPLCLLHPKLVDTSKVVYVARNPKDVAVSYYHQNKLFKAFDYSGDFPMYWDLFQRGLLVSSPYWPHVTEAWERREHPNMHFMFYEDLVNNMSATIKELSNFLNKSVNDDQIQKLLSHLNIDNFRKVNVEKSVKIEGRVNPNAQGFIRRGKVGGNVEFTKELEEIADKWINKNLSKTNLRFPI